MTPKEALRLNCVLAALAYMKAGYRLGHAPRTVEDFADQLSGGLLNPVTGAKNEPVIAEGDMHLRLGPGQVSCVILDMVCAGDKPNGLVKVEFFGHDKKGQAVAYHELSVATHGGHPRHEVR